MSTERLLYYNARLPSEYQGFKEKVGISHALGVIGSSSDGGLSIHKSVLIEGCRLAQAIIGNFAIVSGGTKGGIPEMALDVGRELGMPTIGVFPEDKAKYSASTKIDFAIAVPPQPLSQIAWGVETPTLVDISNAFVLIGGEWGTLTEVSMIMKKNNSRASHGLSPSPIISIIDSGKLAGVLDHLVEIFPTGPGSYTHIENSRELAEAMISSFT